MAKEKNNTFIVPAECRLDKHRARQVLEYLDGASCYYGGLQRHCFMLINHHVYDKKQDLNKHLQAIGNIKTRTANSIITDMAARHKALGELKKQELADLETRIEERQHRLDEECRTVNTLKILTAANWPLSEDCMEYYRLMKRKIWQSARKLNTMIEQKNKLIQQISSDTYSLCFGSKKLFREQYTLEESGWKDHAQWRKEWVCQRQKGMFYNARAEETNGNQMCHLKWIKGDLFELQVLHHDKAERIAACGFVCIPYMTEEIKRQLAFHEKRSVHRQPMSVRFIKRRKGWYMQILLNVSKVDVHTADRSMGVVGIDFNSRFLSISETDRIGNLIESYDIMIPHMGIDREKSLHEIRKAVKDVVGYAASKQKPIAVESLDFARKKARTQKGHNRRYNWMLHGLAYSELFGAIQRRCFKDGVELIEVDPAYTSMAAKKYLPKMKLTVHRGAAWMIARKAMGYRIVVKRSPAQTEHERTARKLGIQKARLKKKKARLIKMTITKRMEKQQQSSAAV